jgi:hypothetical protein
LKQLDRDAAKQALAARVNGPFLGSLGASATVVGVEAGMGELLGYSLRSLAG